MLAQHLPLEHRPRPGRAARRGEDLADLLLAVFRVGEIHPGSRRIIHQRGIVGDRPKQRDARPQLRRYPGFRQVLGCVGRRVVLEQVLQREHYPAIGMVDDVGGELARS
jgi:hypothetical protein